VSQAGGGIESLSRMEGRSAAGPESDEAFDGAQGRFEDKKQFCVLKIAMGINLSKRPFDETLTPPSKKLAFFQQIQYHSTVTFSKHHHF
jgi:hypothetical protein